MRLGKIGGQFAALLETLVGKLALLADHAPSEPQEGSAQKQCDGEEHGEHTTATAEPVLPGKHPHRYRRGEIGGESGVCQILVRARQERPA